jgi:ubiquinone biosynthesis protein UbiJ
MKMNTTSLSLDTLKPLLGRAVQEVLNRTLHLDPTSIEKLTALEGRRIELYLQAPDIALAIDVRQQQLVVGPVNPAQEPDISFKSKLSSILQSLPLFAQGKPAVGAMRISGDIELARLLQNLVQAFDPDWQEPLVKAFGPVFGPQLAKHLQRSLQQAKTSGTHLMQTAAEYASEEIRVVVPKAELEDFNAQVDNIRQRGDRLQARMAQLTGTQSA